MLAADKAKVIDLPPILRARIDLYNSRLHAIDARSPPDAGRLRVVVRQLVPVLHHRHHPHGAERGNHRDIHDNPHGPIPRFTQWELRLLARSSGRERKSCGCGFPATKARVRFVRAHRTLGQRFARLELKDETIMTTAKIARYAQKPGMATVPAAANNAAAAATTKKVALRYAETGIRHFIISAETKWCHTKRWRASRHAIRAGQGSSGRCLRADSLSPCMSTEPSELRLSP